MYCTGVSLCHTVTPPPPPPYHVQISRITEAGLGHVPQGFRPMTREMLAIEPSVRPDALEITKVTTACINACIYNYAYTYMYMYCICTP